jgi:hypothetical protein
MSTDEKLLICRRLGEAEARAAMSASAVEDGSKTIRALKQELFEAEKEVKALEALRDTAETRAYKAEQQLAKVNGWREGLRQRLRDRNDQLVVVQDLVFQYKQQLAQAQAQVAECRKVLLQAKPFREEWLSTKDFEAYKREWDHALSTSCGSDFVPKAELEKAQAQVASLQNHWQIARGRVMANFGHVPTVVRAVEWMEIEMNNVELGNSTSCGSGMIHVSELDATIECLDRIEDFMGDVGHRGTDAIYHQWLCEERTRLQTLRAKAVSKTV